MRKNNKGFTMIEILGAIVIMGVLLMLVVPSISKLMKNFRIEYYSKLENSITETGKEYYLDNKVFLPNGILKSSYTKLSSLIDKDYVENVDDYKGKSCSLDESYVIVIYRGGDNYEYQTCLKCAGDNYQSKTEGTYCDPAWKNNENIEYSFGDNEEIFIYHKTPKEEVREKLLSNINVVKYNKKGIVLDKVSLAEAKIDDVLPENIDELDTNVIDPISNMKETILKYRIETKIKELKAVVYKHQEPKVKMINAKGSNYVSGTWTNKLIITLEKNDDFFEKSNTSIGHFQLSVNDGAWENIVCEMKSEDTCSFTIEKNVDAYYKFRIETNEGKISDETSSYRVKVDVDKPVVTINPNGAEPIVTVGNTTANINFTLSTSDTGGSEIKIRKYSVITSKTTAPTTYTEFTSDTYNYSKNLAGNKYYVWAVVEDNAGNISEGVYPSNVFHVKYEVIYDANGGSGAPSKQYKKYGTDLTLSTGIPTRVGYTFKGWSTNSTGSVEYNSGDVYKTNQAIKLYAVWEDNVLTVNYYSNYATASFSGALNPVGAGKNVLVRTTTHKYSESQPDGLWDYSTSGSSTYLGRTGYTATGNWGTTTSGGNLVNQSTAFASGQALAQALGVDLSSGNATVNIYPQWSENVLTVNYYSNYATASFSGALNTVGAGKNVLVRTTTHKYSESQPDGLWNYSTSGSSTYLGRTGYTATGNWGTTTSGGNLVDQSTPFDSGQALAQALGTDLSSSSQTINIYPQWNANSITIYYYSNYATESFDSPQNSVSSNKNVIVRTVTEYYDSACQSGLWDYSYSGASTYLGRTGYTATGNWGTSTSGGTLIDQSTSYSKCQDLATTLGKDISTGNKTVNIYPQWTINSYTVTYNANGGSVSPTSASANYGSSVTLPTPTRSGGYTFNGWYTASSGGTKKGGAGASYTVESNITLYAQWKAPSIPSHKCVDNSTTRTKNTFAESNAESIIKWYGVNAHNHWCTSDKTTESCIPSNYSNTTTKIPMYHVTCSICGKDMGNKWCPVHGSEGNSSSGGGGKGYEICDASTKSYSSGAINCIGKTQGWTLVSK